MSIVEISDLRVLVSTLRQLIQSHAIRRTKANVFAIGKLRRHQMSLLITRLNDSFKTKLYHQKILVADMKNRIFLLPLLERYPSFDSIDYEVCGFTKHDYAIFLEFLDPVAFEQMKENDDMNQYRKMVEKDILRCLLDQTKALNASNESLQRDIYFFKLMEKVFEK